MLLSGAKIHSSSDRAFGCRSQHLRGRTEVRLVVDEFWSDTVCADAAGAQKAAGLEETLASVVLRASPQAGPVVASRPRYTQQMIEEPATHASALFLWEYADTRQVSQSGITSPTPSSARPGRAKPIAVKAASGPWATARYAPGSLAQDLSRAGCLGACRVPLAAIHTSTAASISEVIARR